MIIKESDLPLEVVLLVINGTALLIAGILLFPVSAGILPYYENGLYGLFLVFFSLQMITLGKTPFGDAGRSRFILAAGVLLAAIGIAVCFIPSFKGFPRILLFLCFGPGGLLLLLRMVFSRNGFLTWIKNGGIYRHLAFGCTVVYVFSMAISLLVLKQNLLTTKMAAVVVIIYGLTVFYLAGVLRKIYNANPDSMKPHDDGIRLSMGQSMVLFMGVLMVILGILLIPVNLGMIPFSGSAQLGLLMVIFAVQMLASGNTPIGVFPRSLLMIVFGIICAVLGIISCIIPDVLVPFLTVLVGVLNILGGVITLVNIFTPFLKRSEKRQADIPPIMVKLFVTQLTMNLVTVMFGTSMLIPHIIPGLVIGIILAANGGLLLYLLHILVAMDKMQKENLR
jgi:hypothetical protein